MLLGIRATFDAAHRLPEHKGLCRNLHGHRYEVEAQLSGSPGPDGVIIDFAEAKCRLKQALAPYDHAVILRHDDPLVAAIDGAIPDQQMVMLDDTPTVENLLPMLAAAIFRQGLPLVRLQVFESENSWAAETYTKQ